MSTDFDRKKLKLKSLAERVSKVDSSLLLRNPRNKDTVEFLRSLPDILAVKDMKKLARAVIEAKSAEASRIFMYGGHVIKCGLGPLLVKWLKNGTINCLATNGAGTIHDIEMALFGETSEDVESGIKDGSFGMWQETGEIYSEAINTAYRNNLGLGEALGNEIIKRKGNIAISPLATACEAGAPVTVHPALGGDIIHPYPVISWEKLARAAEKDFDLLGERVASLTSGVVINAGSAVIMPEVFLKLLTSAINLGREISDITAASFDMIRQYRPLNNVVFRPTRALGGKQIIITGHHELMLPLLDVFLEAEEGGNV
ncbi:MAG: hypothetical protein GQ565_11640 [Candidatus Aegiribacteria sp.]|nr:hypothetical protein [Candidatus Aegiribacteria sp.]